MALAMQSSGFVFCSTLLFAIASSVIVPTSSQAESRQLKEHVALFVFGDSLFDPGNNNYLDLPDVVKGNYPPYGETFFKNSTGRRSDGRIIPDFIAMHANLPLWKPYLEPGQHQFFNGANFASAGGCVLSENFQGPLDLEMQLSYFNNVTSLLRQQLGDAESKKLLMNAVYMFSIGGFDYSFFIQEHPNATESMTREYIKWVTGNMTDVIKEIYELGGRKFALQNIPPIGCWPNTRQKYNLSIDECLEDLLELPRRHNEALLNAIKELEKQLSGFKYLYFDFYSALYDRIINPLKYGFKESKVGCCGSGTYYGANCGLGNYSLCPDPSEYLFFDGVHPTEHGQFQLAELLWSGGLDVTAPLNMQQLFEL